MKKGLVYPLSILLLCAALVLAACSPSQSPAGVKSGESTPAAAQPNNQAAAAPTSGYPAEPAATANQAGYPATGYPAQTSGSVSLQIVKADGSTATLAAADLQKIATTQVSIGQSDQPGYKLSDVLAAAGVTSFQQVVVTGSSGSATLTQAQVTPDVILSTVDPSSLSLAGPQLSADQSVKGVNKIEVK